MLRNFAVFVLAAASAQAQTIHQVTDGESASKWYALRAVHAQHGPDSPRCTDAASHQSCPPLSSAHTAVG